MITFSDLPVEILNLILKQLNFDDILSLSKTNERLNNICRNIIIKETILVGCYYNHFENLKKNWPNVKFTYDLTWLDKMGVDFTYKRLFLVSKQHCTHKN